MTKLDDFNKSLSNLRETLQMVNNALKKLNKDNYYIYKKKKKKTR